MAFFDNDPADQIQLKKSVVVKNDEEYVKVAFDGSDWVDIVGDVDTSSYSLVVDIGFLNIGGILDVAVGVWNPLGTGDVYLKSSTLAGDYVVPVPLPASILLGVFAVGLAGRKLRKFV